MIDEIGFHHATSVAELLADRGCAVEVITPGMVVGQDLGITLDMENWWIRAGGQGHRAVDRARADGRRRHGTLTLLHHPTGAKVERTPDWVVLRRAGPARSSGCTRSCAAAGRRASTGSATASPRAGPTPPSSRASASAQRVG